MKNKNLFLLLGILSVVVFVAFVSACGKDGLVGPQGPQGPVGVTPTPAPLTDIQDMVAQENDYRTEVGQSPLTAGLVCTLYTIPNTTTLYVGAVLTTIGSFTYTGVFNQANTNVSDGLNILPPGLKSVYQTWYAVKCTGSFVFADSAWHSFDISSDDGSLLKVDGAFLSNDGLHGLQTVSGSKLLKYGIHSFELDFFQGAGNEALIVNMDGSVLDNTHFYH